MGRPGRPAIDSKQKRHGVSLPELIVVGVVLGVITIIFLPYYLQAVDKAREAATEAHVRAIQIAVLAYSLDHDGSFPEPNSVTPAGMGQYLESWPSNAWTGKPMVDSVHYVKGDFCYQVWSTAGSSVLTTDHFGLLGYLATPGDPFVVESLHRVPPTATAALISP